jgi:hypothetical protein
MRSSTFTASLFTGLLGATSALADPAATTAAAPDTGSDSAAATPAPAPPEAKHDAPVGAVVDHAPGEEERSAKNALYLEGLGSALFYSINYDRAFGDFSARVGFSYVSVSANASNASGTAGASASASFMAIPITINYLGIGSVRNMLEVGAGATILHMGAGASGFDTSSKSSATAATTIVLPTALVGYRFQPADGGFFFRAGIAPIFGGSSLPVLPWPYLALGGTFGP